MRPLGPESSHTDCVLVVGVSRPKLAAVFLTVMLISLFLTFHVLYDSAVYSLQVSINILCYSVYTIKWNEHVKMPSLAASIHGISTIKLVDSMLLKFILIKRAIYFKTRIYKAYAYFSNTTNNPYFRRVMWIKKMIGRDRHIFCIHPFLTKNFLRITKIMWNIWLRMERFLFFIFFFQFNFLHLILTGWFEHIRESIFLPR